MRLERNLLLWLLSIFWMKIVRIIMEIITLILSIASFAGFVAMWVFPRYFLPSYLNEKGKNVASKEDIAILTDLVERVKKDYTSEIERLKATLHSEEQKTERKRAVYEEMSLALRIFVSGNGGSEDAKNRFLTAYATTWLWASDDVLKKINKFIEIQVQYAAQPSSISQENMRLSYSSTILAMRRDVGFSETSVVTSEYQFVQF